MQWGKMVGFYRYALALLVLYSHLNFQLWAIGGVRINQGVYAVFCFYIVSGYFTGLIFDRFADQAAQTTRFYTDRLLRIMPAFATLIVGVTMIGLVYVEPKLGPSAADYWSPAAWVQALMMPLNKIIGMVIDVPYGPYATVSPVPSLAVEMQFFFVFPLFAMLRTRAILVIMAAAMAGVVGVAFLNPDLLEDYTYRNLSGLLPIFLTGYLLYRHRALGRFGDPIFWVGPAIGAVYFAALLTAKPEHPQWLGENALALATCPVLLWLMMRVRSGELDKLAGYVAYGVFLCHIPVIRLLHLSASVVDLALAVSLATVAAIAVHCAVERPILALRHRTGDAHPQRTPVARREIPSLAPTS